MTKPKKIVVCASGRGSNFCALHSAIYDKKIIDNAQIVGLITDRKNTQVEVFARQHDVSNIEVLDYASFSSRQLFEEVNLKVLTALSPYLVLTLGYMRIVSQEIVKKFKHKIINIHPSLLPSFPGLYAQRQALAYGVRYSGATTHFIDEGLDSGPIIQQKIVNVEGDDTEETLSTRILEKEHELIVETVDLFCRDRLEVIGRQVRIKK